MKATTMNKLVATLVAGLLAASSAAIAQTAAPATTPAPAPAAKAPAAAPAAAPAPAAAAAPAAKAAPAGSVKAIQPGLLEVSGPRVNEVIAAGIQKITATPGKGVRSISVQSPWGNSVFNWPKDVKPVAFTITTGKGGTATISAPGFTDANKADYKAAIDALVPVAIAKTGDNKAAKTHTRK
jgi:hypothetical protein